MTTTQLSTGTWYRTVRNDTGPTQSTINSNNETNNHTSKIVFEAFGFLVWVMDSPNLSGNFENIRGGVLLSPNLTGLKISDEILGSAKNHDRILKPKRMNAME
jgi:hypothetical protein